MLRILHRKVNPRDLDRLICLNAFSLHIKLVNNLIVDQKRYSKYYQLLL